MKITYISKIKKGWKLQQLKKHALKLGLNFKIRNLTTLNQIKNEIGDLGTAVLWSGYTNLEIPIERFAFLSLLARENIVTVNHGILKHPFLTDKYVQQKYVEFCRGIPGIATYQFPDKAALLAAVHKKVLRFPIIKKPRNGARGEGITLIKDRAAMEDDDDYYQDYVFQNYLKNNGDYRVTVVGAKVLAIFKKVAAKGSFLNNVAQGGKAINIYEKDSPSLYKILSKIGLRAASVFDLNYCGVDVMHDIEDKKYYFMEVNALPSLKAFETITKIKITKELLFLCKRLSERKQQSTFAAVKQYYDENFRYLGEKKFHYASRMYLFTKEKKYLSWLKQTDYGVNSNQDIEAILKKKLIKTKKNEVIAGSFMALRRPYFSQYKDLARFSDVLFFDLFARNIYGQDLRPYIRKYVSDDKFLKLYHKLLKDQEALVCLSTHAINYFYLLSFYFKNSENTLIPSIDPACFLKLSRQFYPLKEVKDKTWLHLHIYFLTHCIIAASSYYAEKITNCSHIYLKMLQDAEEIIAKHYFTVSLDAKFEFLVCAKMLAYKSSLEEVIFSEADRSLSDLGNYLVNNLNDNKQITNNYLIAQEHSNVLYLMAHSACKIS